MLRHPPSNSLELFSGSGEVLNVPVEQRETTGVRARAHRQREGPHCHSRRHGVKPENVGELLLLELDRHAPPVLQQSQAAKPAEQGAAYGRTA
eukprot:7729958-Pyramimonas_sp.AAC.1